MQRRNRNARTSAAELLIRRARGRTAILNAIVGRARADAEPFAATRHAACSRRRHGADAPDGLRRSMTLRIHNTLTRATEAFTPIEPGHVRMYVCGITVYDLCHIGHARFMLAFDVVQRWLQAARLRVTYVRNITDIDDKIIRRALERGITHPRAHRRDTSPRCTRTAPRSGLEPPTHEPRATDYVPQMLEHDRPRSRTRAWPIAPPSGDVNFAVRQVPGLRQALGQVARRAARRRARRRARRQGRPARLRAVEGGQGRASPTMPSGRAPTAPAAPAGTSSARRCASALLGEHFDIHGGGLDLQFPHHENEIAQSEGATGGQFVNCWMHNGFLNIDDEKMSKSLGNFFTIRDVLKQFDGETMRFFMLRTHYRSPFNFSDADLDDARSALRRLYTALDAVAAPRRRPIDWDEPRAAAFRAAMNDDFNTPIAVAVLFELAGEVNRGALGRARRCSRALGGDARHPAADRRAPSCKAAPASTRPRIARAIDARAAAKAARDFAGPTASAHELAATRASCSKDSAQGTTWVQGLRCPTGRGRGRAPGPSPRTGTRPAGTCRAATA